MVNRDFINYREEYGREQLAVELMNSDPIQQFKIWYQQAEQAEVPEPNTMTLGTVGDQGFPTVRVVLLKEITDGGLVFYTNFRSRKGREMEKHPKAALNFYWQKMERQVRLDGVITKVADDISDAYFATRPRGSQLGAWVSEQSSVIPSREHLEQQLAHYQKKFEDAEVPRPPHWGGYLLEPVQIEFWQGGPNRLHDRIQYSNHSGEWTRCRLSP